MAERFVIVGSGIAALSAAEALRAACPQAEIILVSEEKHPFYSRPGLAYLLRGDIPERQLTIRNREDLRELALKRVHGRVGQLLPGEHVVVLENGARLSYDRLLLATGATAVAPDFPGGTLDGVVKLDSLLDTRDLLKRARRGVPAVVVGGGITALEIAEGLCARGMEVHYFLRGRRYWSGVLDAAESQIVLDRLAHEGIRLHFETQVAEALGERGRLRAVRTVAGEDVACRMLAVAIGVRPRVELARAAGLQVNRGIVVNERLQTSEPDIFAAGDVAEIIDPVTGKAMLDVLWPVALRQGRVAGANLAGGKVSYKKAVAYNVTQLAGLKVTIIGNVASGEATEDLVAINRGESETWRARTETNVISDTQDVNRVRLVMDERRIIGALVMGAQGWSHPLQELITHEVDISPVRRELAAGGHAAMDALKLFHARWVETAR